MNEVGVNRRSDLGFTLLLLISGFTGISYEVLFGRMLGNIIGDQWAVSASILLTFLVGIGLGTLYAHRLWRHLWLIEAAIGLYAAAFALGAEVIEHWVYASAGWFGADLSGTVVRCVLLLSIPSFLVGCSLPLFAGYLSRIRTGLAFPRAYALHSFGAAATVLMVEFWLLRQVGLQNTVLIMASINGVVAIALRWFFARLRDAEPSETHYVHFPGEHLVALALASVASAIFQLWMIKIAEFLIGPFRETFALALGLVLFGIAVGSVVVRRYKIRFHHVMFANLLGLVWLLGGFELTASLYTHAYPAAVENYWLTVLLKLGILALLTGLPAITFGATVPALIASQDNVAREAGQLLCVASLANAVGFLLMVFVLHEHMDYGSLVIVIAALSGLGLLVSLRKRAAAAVGVTALIGGAVTLNYTTWDEQLLYLGHTAFRSPKQLEEKREALQFPESFKDRQNVFALNTMENGEKIFFINGYVSINLNTPAEQLVGSFASLFAPSTDRALVLGVGSGATAGTVGLLFDETDAVEINPAILNNLHRMANFNFNIKQQERVNIIHDDGIHFVKRDDRRYPLILNTVTTPLYFSSSKLYTHDFFTTVRERLTPNGVYATWVDTRIGDKGMDIILTSLAQAFNQCGLGYITDGYFLLVCTPGKLAVRQPLIAANSPPLRDYFIRNFGVAAEWIAYGLMNANVLSLADENDAPINTLDYPALEFEIARLRTHGFESFRQRLIDNIRFEEIKEYLEPNMAWNPVFLGLHTETILRDSDITRRWRTVLDEHIPDLEQRFMTAKLNYLVYYAKASDSAASHHQLGHQLFLAGYYQDAAQELEKAYAMEDDRADLNFHLATTYELLGRFNDALRHFERELEGKPNDYKLLLSMGRIYLKLQRFEEALGFFESSIEQTEQSDAHFFRGVALGALGNASEAVRAFQQALSLNPKHSQAKRALEQAKSMLK